MNQAPASEGSEGAAVMPPAASADLDPVIEVFKRDVDRTLLIDNLRRTVDERARRMTEFLRAREELRQAALRQQR